MNIKSHSQIVSFIWGIADDVLRDVFVRGKYRDIILPFTIIRRLDALLVPMDYSPQARLIPGFREGLLTMKIGDKIRLFIPPHLGYGETGAGNGLIPPNADLVFDLEIKAITE